MDFECLIEEYLPFDIKKFSCKINFAGVGPRGSLLGLYPKSTLTQLIYAKDEISLVVK